MIKVSRHQERIWALQILYSLDLTEEFNEEVASKKIFNLKEEKILTNDNYYFEELIFGVLNNRKEIDEKISNKAIDWNIDRIGYIERNILRISLYEIEKKVPIGVAINEAVELAKVYVDEKSAKFINGVLATDKSLK